MSLIESRNTNVRHCLRCACTITATLLLAACGATPRPQVGYASEETPDGVGQSAFNAQQDAEYQLRPSDRLAITVLREPELSFEEIMISADGTISLPLTGSVPAAGKTTEQFEQELTGELRNAGLKRPLVSVNVVAYGSHLVTVEGGVTQPGVFTFQPGAKLSAAIALANGPNRVAKLSEVVIFRETDEGTAIALFDYQAVRQGQLADPVIQPGDRVVVGISGLSQFWQDLIRALPAFGLFTNIR